MIRYDTSGFSLGLGEAPKGESDENDEDALLVRFRLAVQKHASSLKLDSRGSEDDDDDDDDDEQRPIQKRDTDEIKPMDMEFIAVESMAPSRPMSSNKPAEAAADGPPPSAKVVPYWMQHCRSIKSPLLRLHQEVVSLVELLQPTADEANDRMSLVSQIQEVAKSLWPHAEVKVFGSYATGLYVPTSDVDLVVLGTEVDVLTGLRALANALTRKGVAKGMQVIAKAKVPIIKFEAADSGLNVDISFDVPNGPQAADLVKEVIGVWPMLRPLVLVIKLFLQQRELNEVYTGGIGSYALIVMLIAFLQLHTSRRRGAAAAAAAQEDKQRRGRGSTRAPASPLEPSLGVLLIDFFRLYGRVINMKTVGVSATGGGHYFSKEEKEGGSWLQDGREFMLSVEDPKDASNDISRSSFNVMRVKSAFDFGYQQLSAPSSPDESLLARILRLGPILSSRRKPSNPLVCYKPPGETTTVSRELPRSKISDMVKEEKGAEGRKDELQEEGKKRKRVEWNVEGSKKRARSPDAEGLDEERTRQMRGRSSEDEDEDEDEDGDEDDEDCDLQDLRRSADDSKRGSRGSKRDRKRAREGGGSKPRHRSGSHVRWD